MKRSTVPAMLLLGASVAGVILSTPRAQAAERPIRWNTGGAVWSTHQQPITTFLATGEITDRGLLDGIHLSGWTADEIRAGMNKPYSVDFLSVANFLYSAPGVQFLDEQTRSYVPYWTLKQDAVVALRSAIMADALDGSISSAGILAALPVDFRLADTDSFDGKQNVCDRVRATTPAQSTSLLSWYVFLPSCIQARQVAVASPSQASTSGTPQRPVKGMW
jgi:hypothetical protein